MYSRCGVLYESHFFPNDFVHHRTDPHNTLFIYIIAFDKTYNFSPLYYIFGNKCIFASKICHQPTTKATIMYICNLIYK